MLNLLTAVLIPATLTPAPMPAPLPHGLTAQVTDPLSHGTLGDGLLSLDEAIRLVNGTLTLAQLSAAEAANVTGAGAVVDHVLIDPMVTLNITVQAPLTPVTGQGLGLVHIEGMVLPGPGGTEIMTLVVATNQAHILALRTHQVEVMGLHFSGGQVAVDVHTTQSGQVHGNIAMIEDCDLHGQTTAGIVVHGAGTDHSGVMLHHVHFHNLAVGVLVDDQSAGGWVMFHGEHCHLDQVALGADVVEAGTGGDMSMCMFFRTEFQGGANFLRVRRTPASDQQMMVRIVHCDVDATGDTVDVQGNALGQTMVHHHHSDLHAGPGNKAMFVWPGTARFDFHGSEVTFDGDVSVAANLFTQRVWQQNNYYVNCTVTFDVDSSLPNLLWNRFENCTIVVPSTASTPVRLRACELVNTTVQGLSALAPVSLEGCWRSGGSLSGQVTELTPAPTRFLTVAEVTPTEPQLGSTFDLIADVPAGVGALWMLTLAIEQPNTSQEPFRFYGDPQIAQSIFFVTGVTQVSVGVPNDPYLTGFEFYLTPVCFSALGYGPELHIPRGGLLRPVL